MSTPDRIQFSSAGAVRLRPVGPAIQTGACSRLAEAERTLEALLDEAEHLHKVGAGGAVQSLVEAWAEVKAARAAMGL